MHPAVAGVLRHFAYDHLPPHLQEVSRPFADLAHLMAHTLEGPELTVGMRKLLEAKDCMVRAALDAGTFDCGHRRDTHPAGDTEACICREPDPI